jgi:nucleotide-binding universal stress UspA family protein
MIQSVLFATDLSVHTPFLLHHVNAIADQHHADIYIVHVVEPFSQMADAVVGAYMPEENRDALKSEGLERICSSIKTRVVDSLEEEYFDGQQGLACIRDVRVLAGRPVDVILGQAAELGADLIIVGSHGQDTTQLHMLGSVTSRLLQRSRIPVYMVPLLRSVDQSSKAS